MPEAPAIVEGRACGDCAMCCMLLEVAALEKPAGRWCAHCSTRRGCDAYDARPEECRSFHCGWLSMPGLDERWKPSKARFLLAAEHDGARLTVVVDPGRPDAWRRAPYHDGLRALAAAAAAFDGQVMVRVGRRVWVVLPDEDVALGELGPDEVVVTEITGSSAGRRLRPMKLPRSDPRAAGLP